MHRLIVQSNTYRMSSRFDEANAAKDPGNQRYWRMNPRRLDAEAIWDSSLAVSGSLTLKADPTRYLRKSNQPDIGLLNPMGGPPVFPPLSADEKAAICSTGRNGRSARIRAMKLDVRSISM